MMRHLPGRAARFIHASDCSFALLGFDTDRGSGAAGIILFGRVNELVFKRTILSVLLFSGLCLVV